MASNYPYGIIRPDFLLWKHAGVITSLLAQIGNWLLAGLGIVLAYSVFRALRAAWQSRQAAYYSLRREAIARLRRWSLISAALFAVMLVIGLAMSAAPPPPPAVVSVSTATPAPTVTQPPPTPAPPATPTPIVLPTATATASPAPSPSPIVTPTATATATPAAPAVLLTPLPGAVPPADGATMTFTTFASVLDANGNPRDAGSVFPSGTRRVRVFFRAAGINNGATWSVFCYNGDELVDQFVGLWQWGPRAQTGRAFCAIDGSTGRYRVTGFLGTTRQFDQPFDLIEAPPPTAASDSSPAPDSSPTPDSTPAG